MKASFIIVASGAAGVMAGPLMKRVMTTTTSIETVYTTIFLGDEPTPTSTEALPTGDTNPDVGVQSFPTGGTSPDINGPEGGYGNGDYDDSIVPEPQPTTTYTPEVVVVAPTTTPTPEEPITTEEPVPEQTITASAPPAETTAPTSGSSGSFSDTSVYHHNVHRANHSAPAMAWGQDYADYAQTLAATCHFAHDTSIGSRDYGQNIAMWATSGNIEDVSKETFIARSITEMWYNGEINLFPANGYGQASPDMSNFEAWGHYSQVIWSGSTVVGCAVQYCPPGTMASGMGAYFSVCNYYPAGNMDGAYDTNVKAPAGEATVNAP